MQTLKQQVGQPIQIIALGLLTKLAHLACRSPLPPSLLASITPLFEEPNAWLDILSGLSTCQPKEAAEGSAQWAKGIDQILSSVEYQRAVLPRDHANELDTCSFSALLKKENAALLENLLGVLYTNVLEEDLKLKLTAILSCSKALTSQSEAEAKAHVVTRAEVYAGMAIYAVIQPNFIL